MVSLGCDKNRVDSELILGAINKHYEITNNAKEADIIIVNTCGFIRRCKARIYWYYFRNGWVQK